MKELIKETGKKLRRNSWTIRKQLRRKLGITNNCQKFKEIGKEFVICRELRRNLCRAMCMDWAAVRKLRRTDI